VNRLTITMIVLVVLATGLPAKGAHASPVPQPTASAVTATAAQATIPTPSPLAVRYYKSGNVLWVVATLWGFALPALLFFSGFSARLRAVAERIRPWWPLALLIYLLFFALIYFVANLPLDYYSDFLRPHAYGLSSQAFGKWLSDEFLSLGIELIAGALFLWIPFLLLKRSPRRWWLYTWLASIPILLCVAFVQPLWIEPLFNHFGPMQDKVLETRILHLAQRAGIQGANVYEVNKSVDTNELNAYVTGIGDTKRIVLWDTLLKELAPDEVVLTMGHEMGHYVLGHVWKSLLYASFIVLTGLWCIHLSVGWILRRFNAHTGVSEPGDIASLPLLLLVFGLFFFILTPPLLAVSRGYEHEADRFGLEITHANGACATLFAKVVQHDLAYPDPAPLVVFFRASHPTLRDRFEFCNSYHPWLEGREGMYSRYFAPP
jgi:STE24 endopeptidase